jgi:hypothetical protein
VGLDINLGGFSLKYSPGVPEALLLISNLLACYTLVLQGNCHLLDAMIKSVLKLETDEELQFIYSVRYFPHESFGGYRAFNQPHIVHNLFHRALLRIITYLFLILLSVTTLAFAAANLFLLLHYLVLHPNFGVWSWVLFAYIFSLGVGCFIYVLLTRARVPYLDYTINNELAVLEQTDKQRWYARLQEVYGKYNALRRDLVRRGYLRD